MGYNTQYVGELKFKKELKASELAYLSRFLGEDTRDHGDWPNIDNYYITLEFLDDYDGLRWDHTEKTYAMDEIINFVIDRMTERYPDFALTGSFNCQGEDIDDRYQIAVENNTAAVIKVPPMGTKITCPHCDEDFYLEEGDDINNGTK